MSKLKSLHGVKVKHFKNTEDCSTEILPIPDRVVISMSQHIGKPCDPTVKITDLVKVGQVIGTSDAFISAPIHSSVSGKVVAVDEILMSNGQKTKAVTIETDKLQEVDESVVPPSVNSFEEFIQAVKASGLVGLGGAGFPTYVKLSPKNLSEVDTLCINAAECEPYITSDYRTIMEDAEDVLNGARQVQKYLDLKKVIIGVEDNKPKAIALLKEMTAGDASIEVASLPAKYPQGAEKVLIYHTTGRVVPEGKLPADVGVIVMNVASVAFLSKYLKTGMPLTTTRVTVDGSAIAEPKNLLVPIGTPIQNLIDFCGGFKTEPGKVLMGGPMMGIAVNRLDYPVLKNNNAILAFDEKDSREPEETPCIRCGRCVNACPFNLMPASIEKAFKAGNVDALRELKVNLCMECGCCAFACPAKRRLVMTNRLAKKMLTQKK